MVLYSDMPLESVDLQKYKLPGQEKITDRALKRYFVDKENFEKEPVIAFLREVDGLTGEALQSAIESAIGKAELFDSVCDVVIRLPDNARINVIKKMMLVDDLSLKLKSLKLIEYVPGGKRGQLYRVIEAILEEAMSTNDESAQRVAVSYVYCVSRDKKFPLIMAGINNENINVAVKAVAEEGAIHYPERAQVQAVIDRKVRELLEEKSIGSFKKAIKLVAVFRNYEHKTELLREFFRIDDDSFCDLQIEVFNIANKQERSALLNEFKVLTDKVIVKGNFAEIEKVLYLAKQAGEEFFVLAIEKVLSLHGDKVARFLTKFIQDIQNIETRANVLQQYIDQCMAEDEDWVEDNFLNIVKNLSILSENGNQKILEFCKQVFKNLLTKDNDKAALLVLNKIGIFSEQEQVEIIEKLAVSVDAKIIEAVVKAIENIDSEKLRLSVFSKILKKMTLNVLKDILCRVSVLSNEQKNVLIEHALQKIRILTNEGNDEERRIAIEMIGVLPLNHVKEFYGFLKKTVDQYVSGGKTEDLLLVVKILPVLDRENAYFSDTEQVDLIAALLKSRNVAVLNSLAKYIYLIPHILPGVATLSTLVQEIPRELRLIMLRGISEVSATDVVELEMSSEDKELLVAPSVLYDKMRTDKNRWFHREALQKSGSETTLVGGPLKGKVIIRHILPEHFMVWQKVYENEALWKAEGFDYIPVEPIVSFKYNQKKGTVDVCSGVLDLNVKEWSVISGGFKKEIAAQCSKIFRVIKKNGVDHNHVHERNFCLKFARNEHGEVDFNIVPRVYLIDFDRATMNR